MTRNWWISLATLAITGGALAQPFMSRGTIAEEPDVEQTTVAQGLERPWGVAWLPDGSMLVTERPGRLRMISASGELQEQPIAGVPEVYAGGQGGLLDVTIDPDFEDNRYVYLTYTVGDRRGNRTRAGRGVLENDRLRDFEVVFENDDLKNGTQHFGSRLAWLSDGTLLMSVGDGGNPPISFEGEHIRQQAQELDTHFGSVVRINPDGSAPEDNPFVDRRNAQPEIWTYGHRNIQGLVVDPETGDVWSNEHGALNGDEINRLEAGQNYGWPAVTFSRDYGTGRLISEDVYGSEYVQPALVWMDNNAPSGITIYRGEVFEEWDGDLLSGALITQDVRRIDLTANGQVRRETRIPIGERVRDVRVGPDGAVYVLTDQTHGRLIKLTPASGS